MLPTIYVMKFVKSIKTNKASNLILNKLRINDNIKTVFFFNILNCHLNSLKLLSKCIPTIFFILYITL